MAQPEGTKVTEDRGSGLLPRSSLRGSGDEDTFLLEKERGLHQVIREACQGESRRLGLGEGAETSLNFRMLGKVSNSNFKWAENHTMSNYACELHLASIYKP